MKILAIDTSGAAACFAAVELNSDNEIERSHVRALTEPRQLSRVVIAELDAVLDEAKWALGDVDAIAVGLGPGSWTGLRIGLTTAKTLAQAREVPIIGVPTFDAFGACGENLCDYCLHFAVAPCRTGAIYEQSWETRDMMLTPRGGARIVAPQELADEIAAASPPWLAFMATAEGMPSVAAVTEKVQGFGTEIVEVTPQRLAENIAQLAAARLQNGDSDDVMTLSPLYLAPSSAERVYAEKMARAAGP